MFFISSVIFPDFAQLWRDQNKPKFKIHYQIFADNPENGLWISPHYFFSDNPENGLWNSPHDFFICWKHNASDYPSNFWLNL